MASKSIQLRQRMVLWKVPFRSALLSHLELVPAEQQKAHYPHLLFGTHLSAGLRSPRQAFGLVPVCSWEQALERLIVMLSRSVRL
jgi:hypothetical protein